MLGMDNYYGGITIGLNDVGSFNAFNTRMDRPEDQLGGLSYQGLTHLHRCASASIDSYRKAAMGKIRLGSMVSSLSRQSIPEGTTSPLQILRIEDKRLIFLDIKFPHLPKSGGGL